MDPLTDPRRVAGALAFAVDLEAFARDCVATGAWDDELAQRRRQRDDARGSLAAEELRVKAL